MRASQILHYQLLEQIGAGGMAVVYKAIDTRLGRTVALKLLPPLVTAREEAHERMIIEARAAARLDHPNIATIYALEQSDDGQLLLVMAYYPGETLQDRLTRGPLSLDAALDITRQTLRGLGHAHRAGIVHRDIKPANLLLTPEGEVKILDFGLARLKEPSGLTRDGAMMGTMEYMAPEQARGQAVDGRADLWSLGVVLYEMLTGLSPFLAEGGLAATLLRILSHQPEPLGALRPDLPPALEQVVAGALERDPGKRYASADAFLAALANLQGEQSAVPAEVAMRPAVAAMGSPSDSEPRAAARPGGRLPRPRAPLVGRRAELEVIALHLSDPACQVLTLLGPGGTGKTRLSLEVAWRQRDGESFPDGVCFVELDTLTDPERLPARIAEALDVPLDADEDPLAGLTRRLAGKQVLLVLDNFEQVVEAAATVAELVDRCPQLTVLISSRERLDIDQEWIVPIQGLPYPADSSLEAAPSGEGFEAVELFLQRARRVRPDFRLTPETLPEVIEICRLTKGLPLGIELAAAWVRSVEPAAIAAEIRRNRDFLSSTSRNVVERHRSIRAVFEHSWTLLEERQQSVLRRLAVFRGGFTAAAAAAVAQADLAMLTSLVDASLLDVAAAGRFELHPLLRQYAEEKLALDQREQQQVAEAHGTTYLALLEYEGRRFRGPEQGEALAAVDLEVSNVRAAWVWAVGAKRSDLLGRASEALRVYHDQRGLISEGLELLAAAAAGIEAGSGPGSEAASKSATALGQLRVDRAWLALRAGRYRDARELAERALERLPATGFSRARILGLNAAGAAVAREGDFGRAAGLFAEALAAARTAADPELQALSLDNLASVEQAQGCVAEAQAHYQESLVLSRQAGDLAQVALTLNNLGSLLLDVEGPAVAAPRFAEGLALAQRLGLRRLLPFLLANLGLVAFHLGKLDHAGSRYREALELVRRGGEAWLEPALQTQLGRIALQQQRFDDAEAFLLDSLGAAWALRDLPMTLQALTLLCELDLVRGLDLLVPDLLALIVAHPATQQADREHARSLLAGLPLAPPAPDDDLAPQLGAAVRQWLQRRPAGTAAAASLTARPGGGPP